MLKAHQTILFGFQMQFQYSNSTHCVIQVFENDLYFSVFITKCTLCKYTIASIMLRAHQTILFVVCLLVQAFKCSSTTLTVHTVLFKFLKWSHRWLLMLHIRLGTDMDFCSQNIEISKLFTTILVSSNLLVLLNYLTILTYVQNKILPSVHKFMNSNPCNNKCIKKLLTMFTEIALKNTWHTMNFYNYHHSVAHTKCIHF